MGQNDQEKRKVHPFKRVSDPAELDAALRPQQEGL